MAFLGAPLSAELSSSGCECPLWVISGRLSADRECLLPKNGQGVPASRFVECCPLSAGLAASPPRSDESFRPTKKPCKWPSSLPRALRATCTRSGYEPVNACRRCGVTTPSLQRTFKKARKVHRPLANKRYAQMRSITNLTRILPFASIPHQKSPLGSYPDCANLVAKLSMVSTASFRVGYG